MKTRKCKQCEKLFYETPSRIKEGRGKYCSVLCYRKAQRKHYKKELNPKEIIHLYVKEKIPATKIAKRYGCDYKRIYGILRKEGIPRREMSDAKKGIVAKNPRYRTDLDEQAIINDYESGLSTKEIAEKYRCSKRTVQRRLMRVGHRLRTSKEGQNLFLKSDRFPEWAEFMRKKVIRQYERGDFPRQSSTGIEMLVKKELEKRGYKEGKDFAHQLKFYDKFMCDFIFLKQKLIVECDGDFWHANPAKYAGKKLRPAQKRTLAMDKSKEAYIKKVDKGSWKLLRFWGSDIRKNVEEVVDEIEKALRKR